MFKDLMLDETNAPLVAYLHNKGLSTEEIVKELSNEMHRYMINIFKSGSQGDSKKTSDSKRLLSIAQKTKEYIKKYGEGAIQDLTKVADSQLEKWCSEIGDIDMTLPKEHPNHPEY